MTDPLNSPQGVHIGMNIKENQCVNFTKNILRESLRCGNSLVSSTSPPDTEVNHKNNRLRSKDSEVDPMCVGRQTTLQKLCPCFAFLWRPQNLERPANRTSELKVAKISDLYEVLGHSEILSSEDMDNIYLCLPPRAIGNPWVMNFSTSKHGFSLRRLYNKMCVLQDTPVLIVIQDVKKRVFGSVICTKLKISEYFYGSGASFVFKCNPTFENYTWKGRNSYFIQSTENSIVIGSGNGKFGIWIDSDLNNGRTQECETFGSPPLVEEEDFIIQNIECWTFENN